jgi:hypothetical protein
MEKQDNSEGKKMMDRIIKGKGNNGKRKSYKKGKWTYKIERKTLLVTNLARKIIDSLIEKAELPQSKPKL